MVRPYVPVSVWSHVVRPYVHARVCGDMWCGLVSMHVCVCVVMCGAALCPCTCVCGDVWCGLMSMHLCVCVVICPCTCVCVCVW